MEVDQAQDGSNNAEYLDTKDYLGQLQAEKELLDPSYLVATKLLSEEIERIQKGGDAAQKDNFLELHHDKPMKLVEKVLVPVKEFPKFNFVGKLLGPKGNSLRRLQEITGARISVFGKGSARGKKEEEIRKDPSKAALLEEELHVSVEVQGIAAEVYDRMGYALSELQKFLTPTRDDEIAQQQMAELMELNPDGGRGRGGASRSRGIGRGAPGATRGLPRGAPASGRGAVRGASAAMRGPARGTRGAAVPRARGAPRGRGAMTRGRGAVQAAPVENYYAEKFPTYDPSYESYDQYDASAGNQYYGSLGESWPAEQSTYGKAPAARGAPRSRPYAPVTSTRGAAF